MTAHTRAELAAYLRKAQEERADRISLTIGMPLAAQINRARLMGLMDMLLPLCQHRSQVIRRARSGEWYLSARLYYRAGLRIADAWRKGEKKLLSPSELQALARAVEIVHVVCMQHASDEDRVHAIMETLHSLAVYDNPPVGAPGRGDVVSALSVLLHGRANCQGFSDAFFLLCTLAGMETDYRIGYKGAEMHLWNTLTLQGRRIHADATSGCMGMDDAQCRAMGLRWEEEDFTPDKA